MDVVRHQYLVCSSDFGDRFLEATEKMSCVEILERVATDVGQLSLWCGRSRVDEEALVDPSLVYRVRCGGLMGGKGGFGAMLRSMGKRSGQTTQDFGACRDLQGRRLRRVNDEIALERWHDARTRKEESKGWHLGVPSWAEVPKARKSKAAMRKEAARRSWKDEEAAVLESGAETKNWVGTVTMVDSMRHGFCVIDGNCYVPYNANCEDDDDWGEYPPRVGDEAEVWAAYRPKGRNQWSAYKVRRIRKASSGGKVRAKREAVVARHASRRRDAQRKRETRPERQEPREGNERSSVLDAVAAGLEAAKRARLRKLEEKESLKPIAPVLGSELTFGRGSSAIVGVLSGSARVYGRIVRGSSQFCTISPLEAVAEPVTSGKRYYEAKLITSGIMQIGWAHPDNFAADDDEGDGVGDDIWSWGYDGCRRFVWTNEKPTQYGGDDSWQIGDVVGCCLDAEAGTMEFSLNGKSLGVAYANGIPKGLVPAISLEEDEAMEIALDAANQQYLPQGYRSLRDDDGPVSSSLEQTSIPLSTEKDTGDVSADLAASSDPIPATAAEEVEPPENLSEEAPSISQRTKRTKPAPPKVVQPEPLENLDSFASIEELEELGLDRLKAALAAEGCKCGGSLRERATRLFSIKGKRREEWDPKVLAPPAKSSSKK